MASQRNSAQVAGKGPQNTPIEQLQQQDAQSPEQPSAEQRAQGHDYTVNQHIAEMEAGNLPPSVASDPAAPGVQDLMIGGTAWLAQADQSLQIYARPGASSILATLEPDTQVSVIEGPQDHSGAQWVRVRTAEGQEGWVKSDELRGK